MRYELYICVVGGDDDDERLICESNKMQDIDQAILNTQEEVITNADKYYMLNDFTFYSYNDFLTIVNSVRAR